jgi:hypothetical protein
VFLVLLSAASECRTFSLALGFTSSAQRRLRALSMLDDDFPRALNRCILATVCMASVIAFLNLEVLPELRPSNFI